MTTENKVWIIAFHEPLYYGPLLKQLIDKHADKLAGVIVVSSPFFQSLPAFFSELIYRYQFWGFRGFVYILKKYLVNGWMGKGDFAKSAKAKGLLVNFVPDLQEAESFLKDHYVHWGIIVSTVKVPNSLLQKSQQGWLNLHCGLLPKYAGVDAPFWALLNEEKFLGVTIHKMSERFDAGDIVKQEEVVNSREPYFIQLERLFKAAEKLFDQIFESIDNLPVLKAQDPSKRSYFSKPTINDGRHFRSRGGKFI